MSEKEFERIIDEKLKAHEKLIDEKLEIQTSKITQQITQTLIDEIAKLKEEQEKIIKEAVEKSIKENFISLMEEKHNEIVKMLDEMENKLEKENLKEFSKVKKGLSIVSENLIKAYKDLKEDDKELIKKGEQILEDLEEVGKMIYEAHESIRDGEHFWGKTMLERFTDLGKALAIIAKRIDNSEKYLQTNIENVWKIAKDTKDLVNRPRW